MKGYHPCCWKREKKLNWIDIDIDDLADLYIWIEEKN